MAFPIQFSNSNSSWSTDPTDCVINFTGNALVLSVAGIGIAAIAKTERLAKIALMVGKISLLGSVVGGGIIATVYYLLLTENWFNPH